MVDMKGRAHTESWSDINTLADVQKEQLNSGKKRALRRLTLFGKRITQMLIVVSLPNIPFF